MPTKKRIIKSGEYYHIYNRGAHKSTIFHFQKDYERFLNSMILYKDKFPVDVIAYSLIGNHFHLILKEVSHDKTNIPTFMHRVSTSFAKYYQYQYKDFHSGVVFQGRFKSKLIDNKKYLIKLINYIHKQPSHHFGDKSVELISIVNSSFNIDLEWPYSSVHEYLKKSKPLFEMTCIDSFIVDINKYPYLFDEYKVDINEELE